jgi:hypothetical protein
MEDTKENVILRQSNRFNALNNQQPTSPYDTHKILCFRRIPLCSVKDYVKQFLTLSNSVYSHNMYICTEYL